MQLRFAWASLICLFAVPMAANAEQAKDARLTVGVPVYVTHDTDRSGSRGWNEGWFNNEGVLADVSWPVWEFTPHTRIRAGGTAGGFDNSIYKTSIFFGGMGELETDVTKRWTLSLGTYAGAITGYENDVSPAIAPYVGTSYEVTDRLELGLRGFWLPAKTVAGADIAESDAYVAAVTVGTRF